MKYKKNIGTLGAIGNHAGEFVSINLKQTNFFGLGTDGFAPKMWLSEKNWCDKVPDTLNEEEFEQLAKGLSDGSIVLGEKWIPALDKDKAVMEKYLDYLDQFGFLTQEFKDIIIRLIRYKSEGNYTALEIYRAMLVKEKQTRNRQPFLTYLQEAINHYIGPVQLVQDYPNDPDNYTVTIDSDTGLVTSSSDKRDVVVPTINIDKSKERIETLDKILGDSI